MEAFLKHFWLTYLSTFNVFIVQNVHESLNHLGLMTHILVICLTIGANNGLSPVQWKLQWNFSHNWNIFIQKYAFESLENVGHFASSSMC